MVYIAWAPEYQHPLPQGHRFPMEKYALIPEQLLFEGSILPEQLFRPEPLNEAEILQVHDADYWQSLRNLTIIEREMRKTGFPLSPALVDREILIAGGTWQAAKYALENGVALNVAGGTHHAFRNRGEGFCLLNDIALATELLLKQMLAKKVLVVDLDVHQGNGTAAIFAGRSDVFTFSMHGKKNYPHHKEKSHLDIELDDHTGDDAYLSLLGELLPKLINQQKPDFIFFQSGVDVLAGDKLGRLALSMQGCRQRDQLVMEHAAKHQIPLVTVMGGGYSPRIADVVEAHANTFRTACHIWS